MYDCTNQERDLTDTPKPKSQRLPPWIRTTIHRGENRDFVRELVDGLNLNTVCTSAKCPNLAECWHCRTATIMILGDCCTRRCRFCAVSTGGMLPPDPKEPVTVAQAAEKMALRFVVLTSVDRDDLKDLGSGHWRRTVEAIHEQVPAVGTEVLVPDFKGRDDLIADVVESQPSVFAHNLETCERLTKEIRSGNAYGRSLDVLRRARTLGGERMAVKSGVMVGLGESDDEVLTCIRHMYDAGATVLTLGQYLRPTRDQLAVDRYVEPEVFDHWKAFALDLGFRAVSSAPMVRSSYKAEELARQALNFQGDDWSELATRNVTGE